LHKRSKWGTYVKKFSPAKAQRRNVVVEPRFYGVEPFSEGLAAIFEPKRGGFGFIDRSGREVIEPQFDGVGLFVGGCVWVSMAGAGGGYIDRAGRYIWKPEKR
jgi:hypothetical protein